MSDLDDDARLATIEELLRTSGMGEAAEIVRQSSVEIAETGYDNWNGGTRIYTAYFDIDPSSFGRLGDRKSTLEEQITARTKIVYGEGDNLWISATIRPKIKAREDWRAPAGTLSRRARQNIIDGMKVEGVSWFGTLDDVEFLQRLWDLETLPSHDNRYKDAAGDIWQHRINNYDWEPDWIFADRRFNLINCPAEQFLGFLAETVHPVVRPDRNEALKLVSHFNDQLRPEGWILVEEELIAGRPKFVAKSVEDLGVRSVSRAKTVADALDAGWMKKEIERLENSIDKDPALAIGTAKELVESCCKSILTKRGVEYPSSADLPKLTKLLTKELRLVPQGISQEAKGAEAIKRILGNLAAQTQYLAELRGLYGSGHGRDGKYVGLQPRHARLAVGAAVSFIDFVTETYRERSAEHGDREVG